MNGKFFVEKQFEENERVRYRFVAKEPQDCLVVNAKIEDGYICILEEI